MIKANDLDGRAVVDLESAKKVGYVDEIYLNTDGARIAAYLVSEGSKLTGGGSKVLMPASAVQTIGPEAIMVRPVGEAQMERDALDRLPRLSHIKGRKVVSEAGKLLGTIDDVLLDDADGHIHGYTLKSPSWTGGLSDLFGGGDDHPDYVRGDANLRLGEDLLVVPEDAVVFGKPHHNDDDSSIESLSSSSRPTSRTHMPPPEPADVAYAEPIHHAERSSFEPVGQTERTAHWDDVRDQYRTRWEHRTGGRGGLWEEHEPGYRYGWEMASRPDYRGKTWTTAEPELRRDWEHRHHDRPWDRVVDTIRDAWEGVTDRDRTDVAGYRTHDDQAPGAIERLSERPMPHDVTAPDRVTTRPVTYSDETVTESERFATRPVTDEGPDSRRSLL